MSRMSIRTDGVLTIIEPEVVPRVDIISTVRLGLSGGVMMFDVTETDPVPVLEIYDIEAAAWWLPSLLGDDAADRIIDFTIRIDELNDHQRESGTVQAPVSEGEEITADLAGAPLADPLRRLALLLWLHRWWPGESDSVPELPVWLLDAEAGVLADRVEVALDEEVALIDHLLGSHLERIAANLADHNARIHESPPDQRIDQVLRDAALAALAALDPETPGFSGLDQIERGVTEADELARELDANLTDEVGLNRFFTEEGQRSERTHANQEFALVAGGGNGAAPDGASPIDPRAVPARIFSHASDAISWWVGEEDGGVKCEVEVLLSHEQQRAVARDQVDFGAYFARADYGGISTVITLFRQKSQAAPGNWVLAGEAWLDATADTRAVEVVLFPLDEGAGNRVKRSVRERITDIRTIESIVTQRKGRAATEAAGDADGPPAWSAPSAAELASYAQVRLR